MCSTARRPAGTAHRHGTRHSEASYLLGKYPGASAEGALLRTLAGDRFRIESLGAADLTVAEPIGIAAELQRTAVVRAFPWSALWYVGLLAGGDRSTGERRHENAASRRFQLRPGDR